MEGNPLFEALTRKLELLSQRQEQFQNEIADLKKVLADLKAPAPPSTEPVILPVPVTNPDPIYVGQESPVETPVVNIPLINFPPPVARKKKEKTPIEEFIGTNLLNKIGIAVVVIGVGIGAEYAIDHDLISPLTRIILGYLCGIALVGVAIRLKQKYASFSAVLLSGGMAVFYFITFAAYDLYQLFPKEIAFALMVIFTAFTVFAALQYNLQVIAIIGLVGAYGVPFLLSDGSGQVGVLFTYMTIVNTGILVLGFRKYWKLLYYLSFAFTWLIFLTWYLAKFNETEHLWLELGFSTVFFAIFYTAVLAYKIIRGENLTKKDITFVLLNSFLYYGMGYFTINIQINGGVYLGVFTLFNAILHFVVCYVIFKSKGQSKGIFLFAAGLVLVFLTLAVPVQLDGNWVTIIWGVEALMLFWLGRTKGYPGYEKLSYPLILLALGSLYQDWSSFYGHYYKGLPETHVNSFFNIQLLTSLIVCGALGMIVKISYDRRYPSPLTEGNISNEALTKGLPALVVLTLFGTFFYEVETFWQQRFIDSQLSAHAYGESDYIQDFDVLRFKTIWLLNYSAILVLILGWINYFRVKNQVVSYITAAVGALVAFLLITAGLMNAAELRASYLAQTDATYYFRDAGHLLIRYVCIALVVAILFMNYKITRQDFIDDVVRKAERIFFHVVILSLLSSELVSGLALLSIADSDKLALSILWGIYALGLIVYGLIRDHKYIRITAIVLFGITLVKLFFYDMAAMGTIQKTLVMIILGVLLLVASFLYNKFKKQSDEKE